MNTSQRIAAYEQQNAGRPFTARQRRRIVKRAGTDPQATVVKDDGMGYPPSRQGFRELIGCEP